MKILVVEDNEQNLYLMRFILEKNGYEVVTAQDGISGVKKALEEKPDLILMDLQLPEIDGYEAARRIKQIPEARDIPIVAVTSYAMVGNQKKALDAGCIGYIEKPIKPESFIKEVERYLP